MVWINLGFFTQICAQFSSLNFLYTLARELSKLAVTNVKTVTRES